nr:HAMP domain-containing sensor histidine kinase [Desulfobotulus pelophilus]
MRKSLRNAMLVMLVSITALGISFFLYIRWFMEVRAGLLELARTLNLDGDRILAPETFSVVLTLSVLVGLILVGLSVIYFYYRRALSLYRVQRRFFRSFTHELKTPVASIRLYLDTFIRHELPREEALRYLGYMKQNAERLSEQIEMILNLARIEGGVTPLAPEPVDLGRKIQAIHASQPHLAVLSLVVTGEKDPLFYPVDPVLFTMVVTNLMENALRYNDSDKPAMLVNLDKREKDILLSFNDNGLGLQKKHLKSVFRRFFRANPMGPTPGTGLGLHLVGHLVRMHKGRIWAESDGPGRGSTFLISLPLKKRDLAKNEKKNSDNRR